MRYSAMAFVMLLAFAGCNSTPPTMPNVVGKQLDVAKSDLKRANIDGEAEVLGGGVFGILQEHNWQVCEQLPAAGAPVTEKPRLTVARSCEGDDRDGSPSSQPTTTQSASASTAVASPSVTASDKVTETTVDKLVNRLNSSKMGGIKTGDLFRVTGVLTGSPWGTGASGDYYVYLETKKGSDLLVFIDESETLDWEDGTKVEMILEATEVTINGETTDGWMRAREARTVS